MVDLPQPPSPSSERRAGSWDRLKEHAGGAVNQLTEFPKAIYGGFKSLGGTPQEQADASKEMFRTNPFIAPFEQLAGIPEGVRNEVALGKQALGGDPRAQGAISTDALLALLPFLMKGTGPTLGAAGRTVGRAGEALGAGAKAGAEKLPLVGPPVKAAFSAGADAWKAGGEKPPMPLPAGSSQTPLRPAPTAPVQMPRGMPPAPAPQASTTGVTPQQPVGMPGPEVGRAPQPQRMTPPPPSTTGPIPREMPPQPGVSSVPSPTSSTMPPQGAPSRASSGPPSGGGGAPNPRELMARVQQIKQQKPWMDTEDALAELAQQEQAPVDPYQTPSTGAGRWVPPWRTGETIPGPGGEPIEARSLPRAELKRLPQPPEPPVPEPPVEGPPRGDVRDVEILRGQDRTPSGMQGPPIPPDPKFWNEAPPKVVSSVPTPESMLTAKELAERTAARMKAGGKVSEVPSAKPKGRHVHGVRKKAG